MNIEKDIQFMLDRLDAIKREQDEEAQNDNSSNCNTSSKDIDDIKNLQLQLNQQNVDDNNLESKLELELEHE